MTLYIRTKQGKQYHILDDGNIKRLDQPDFVPSGQWRMDGLMHTRFHRGAQKPILTLSQIRRAYHPSDVMPEPKPELLFKNGKPRYFVIDTDHGTRRVWGDGIVDIRRID